MRCPKTLLVLPFLGASAFGFNVWAAPSFQTTAQDALSEDVKTREAAIATLRAQGPKGLQTFLAAHQDQNPAVRRAAGKIAAQKDAHISRLYWYTDLSAAKAAAQQQKKPILSLRMLGRLDEALSCANSRFFRTALYANKTVSDYLRKHYILHWSSERPVPKVTIDMGDGRKIQTTVTGNSIHYVLDAFGRPIDALPGLYGPMRFKRELQRSEALAQKLAPLPHGARQVILQTHHQERAKEPRMARKLVRLMNNFPTAARAVPIAPAKSAAETPLMPPTPPSLGRDAKAPTNDDWTELAKQRSARETLDAQSIQLLKAQSKGMTEVQLKFRITKFEELMTIDTLKNELSIRPKIRSWFQGGLVKNLEQLNARVYSELFETPANDAWLGLISDGVYTGLQNDGVVR